jgi:hypothetical protein
MEFEASGKLYAERDDWKDVVPVPQDDGPHPVVRIAYAKECELSLRNICAIRELQM